MTRKRVSLALTELVELFSHPVDTFFTAFRCRLCGSPGTGVDRETALNNAAQHLADAHRAQGGQHRKPHARQTRRRR